MKKMALFGLLTLAAAVSIFFFIFAFSGFDFAYLQKNFSVGFVGNSKAGLHIKLGTEEYVSGVLDMERGEGPRSALSQVMRDVREHPKELDKNTEDNINRLHKLISTLIYHIGYVDEEVHYFRNELNRAPKSLKALMDENMKLPLRKRWKLLSVRASAYHIQGPEGAYNLKFMSYDSYSEAVYDKNGVLLTEKNDPINMGTYNYAAGISILNSHNRYDVSPYIKWGNTPDSTQKGSAEINTGVQQGMENYKRNALNVYQYRNKLFGMQEGRVP